MIGFSVSMICIAEATPKTIMRTMGVKGLTLYHLKSHLQVSSIIRSHKYDLRFYDSLGLTLTNGCEGGREWHKKHGA